LPRLVGLLFLLAIKLLLDFLQSCALSPAPETTHKSCPTRSNPVFSSRHDTVVMFQRGLMRLDKKQNSNKDANTHTIPIANPLNSGLNGLLIMTPLYEPEIPHECADVNAQADKWYQPKPSSRCHAIGARIVVGLKTAEAHDYHQIKDQPCEDVKVTCV